MIQEQPMYVEFVSGEHQALIKLPENIITDAITKYITETVDDDELLTGGEWRLLGPKESEAYDSYLDQGLNWYDNEVVDEHNHEQAQED
jgi:hypothetical protein